MRTILLSFILGLIALVNISAQDYSENINENPLLAKEGTFELISKTKIQEIFTKEEFIKIQALVEENRKETEEVLINYSIYTEIRIPSKKEIENLYRFQFNEQPNKKN